MNTRLSQQISRMTMDKYEKVITELPKFKNLTKQEAVRKAKEDESFNDAFNDVYVKLFKENVELKARNNSRKQMSGDNPYKAIHTAFKDLYKVIEKNAPAIGEDLIDTVKEQLNSVTQRTEQILDKKRQQAIDAAEEELRKAQRKLEELKTKYNA